MQVRGPVPQGLEQQLVHQAGDGRILRRLGTGLDLAQGLGRRLVQAGPVAVGQGQARAQVLLGGAGHRHRQAAVGFHLGQGVQVEDVGHGQAQHPLLQRHGQHPQPAGQGLRHQGQGLRGDGHLGQVQPGQAGLGGQRRPQGPGRKVSQAHQGLAQEGAGALLFLEGLGQLPGRDLATAQEAFTYPFAGRQGA